jgi:hypothetical protein
VTGRWKVLHNEELYNFHSFPDIIMITKSRKSKWARCAAQTVKMENHIPFAKREGTGLLVRSAFSWERTI